MCAILAAMMIMLSCAIAEENAYKYNYDTARSLASFMEDHYGVTILIGDECDGIETDGFEIGDQPAGSSPLLDALGEQIGWTDYEEEIKILDDCFSVYPPAFFEKFKCAEAENGIRFLLPNRIIEENRTLAGLTDIQDGYYNVFLGIGAFNSINIHHEIWHAMELKITAEYPDAFADWNTLNPEGFQYSGDYFLEDYLEQAAPAGDWFVRGYSTINEMEDRATVVEAFYKYDSAWWDEHPHIQDKLGAIATASALIWEDMYSAE